RQHFHNNVKRIQATSSNRHTPPAIGSHRGRPASGRSAAMPTNARNSKRVAILYASVASAILMSFANPVMAGGVSVSVGGHSVVSVPGGGGAGGIGGAAGGLGGSLGSGLGGGVGGISSGLGGASDALSGGQGFFSGGANFGPRNATGPNFFSGAANFGNRAATRAATKTLRVRPAAKPVIEHTSKVIPRKSIG